VHEHLPNVAAASHFIFGHDNEYYAAHLIRFSPSFDQLVRIELEPFAQTLLAHQVTLEASLIDTQAFEAEALSDETVYSFSVGTRPLYRFKVKEPLYFEHDDLE
jgi:hypothetical protein